MNRSKIMQIVIIIIVIMAISCGGGSKKTDTDTMEDASVMSRDDSRDLKASMAYLPGLIETENKGTFVDLVKELDKYYTEGNIIIEIYPLARSVENVIEGRADFHVPVFRNPAVPEDPLPYQTVTESMGSVVFILYSHVDNKITKNNIDAASAQGGEFPYEIEAGGGLETSFPFPILPTNDIASAFKKLQNKRIDAFLWAQEEADITLKDLKLNEVWRSYYTTFEDCLLIQKGPEGDKIDAILSAALKKLKASDRYEELFAKIHLPFDDWQPSEMGW